MVEQSRQSRMKRTNISRITTLILILLTLGLGFATAQTTKAAKTNAEIRQEIIKRSIASYKGTCPCPYSVDRAGRMCGRRSAYSKPGGASPICYEKDVTPKMMIDYRKRTKL